MGMAVGRDDEDQFIGDRLGGLSLMLDFFTTCSEPTWNFENLRELKSGDR